jgi:hypothetical protein
MALLRLCLRLLGILAMPIPRHGGLSCTQASDFGAPSAESVRPQFRSWLSLPKSRFERTDDVGRQGSDAQRCLRTARLGVCRVRPSRAKHAFVPRYNRWHISQGFGEGAPVERDQMISALAPDRPDQAFSISVLPGRAERGGRSRMPIARTRALNVPPNALS